MKKSVLVKNIYSDKDFLKTYRKLNESIEDFVDAEETSTDDFIDANEDLSEDVDINEAAGDTAAIKTMSDEDLKVEALKIATNIAKLMSNVTALDVVSIAGTVSDFIRNHEIGDAESTDEFLTKDEEAEKIEETPESEDFKTGDEEVSDESES